MGQYVNYIAGEGDPTTGAWKDLREFRFTLERGEFTLIWAAMQVRSKALEAAEKVFPDYKHPETIIIDDKKRIIEFGSALKILQGKLLVTCEGKNDDPELIKTIQRGERTGYTWRVREEPALQAMASIGWLCDIAKARQPPITKSSTDVSYPEDLLPSNLNIKNEEAPSGYNEKQKNLMEEAQKYMSKILKDIPDVQSQWIGIPLITFGQKLFRTTSKIFTSLPDLEEEERKKFEELKAKAKAEAPPPAEG